MNVYFFERFEIMRPAILGKVVRMQEHEFTRLGQHGAGFCERRILPKGVVVDMPQVGHSTKRISRCFLHSIHE